MKTCELCNFPARMYCESDQASLCWDCDAKVHSANFLVARHSRSLLCHGCQTPTPWKASGARLGRTVSVCEKCVNDCNPRQERDGEEEKESERGNDEDDNELDGEDLEDDVDVDVDEDEDDEDEDEDDGDDDEDGENQVVPWSSTPPPPVTSSSSSEESSSRFSGGGGGVSASAVTLSLKRLRQNADLGPEDDLGCSSSQPNYNATLAALSARESGDDEATSSGSFRPLKEQRRTLEARSTQVSAQDIAESTSAALIGSLKRFQQDIICGNDASATILGICKLSKDPRAVDLVSTDSLNPPI